MSVGLGVCPLTAAAEYVDSEKGVESAEEALQGAADIIAEDISDNAEYRKEVRRLTYRDGILKTVGAKDEAAEIYTESISTPMQIPTIT